MAKNQSNFDGDLISMICGATKADWMATSDLAIKHKLKRLHDFDLDMISTVRLLVRYSSY